MCSHTALLEAPQSIAVIVIGPGLRLIPHTALLEAKRRTVCWKTYQSFPFVQESAWAVNKEMILGLPIIGERFVEHDV